MESSFTFPWSARLNNTGAYLEHGGSMDAIVIIVCVLIVGLIIEVLWK